MSSLEARTLALETSMNTRFDLIMGRVSDLDTPERSMKTAPSGSGGTGEAG
jgi:hypothetical protein